MHLLEYRPCSPSGSAAWTKLLTNPFCEAGRLETLIVHRSRDSINYCISRQDMTMQTIDL